jgi:superfamily I DNA/RNA helicase
LRVPALEKQTLSRIAVAYLILRHVDPMLLTFSRRAAVEKSRRVQHIASHVLPERARLMVGALTWSGTFHAIGARLLREYSEQIGLERFFAHQQWSNGDRHMYAVRTRFIPNESSTISSNVRGRPRAAKAVLARPHPRRPWISELDTDVALVRAMKPALPWTAERSGAVMTQPQNP